MTNYPRPVLTRPEIPTGPVKPAPAPLLLSTGETAIYLKIDSDRLLFDTLAPFRPWTVIGPGWTNHAHSRTDLGWHDVEKGNATARNNGSPIVHVSSAGEYLGGSSFIGPNRPLTAPNGQTFSPVAYARGWSSALAPARNAPATGTTGQPDRNGLLPATGPKVWTVDDTGQPIVSEGRSARPLAGLADILYSLTTTEASDLPNPNDWTEWNVGADGSRDASSASRLVINRVRRDVTVATGPKRPAPIVRFNRCLTCLDSWTGPGDIRRYKNVPEVVNGWQLTGHVRASFYGSRLDSCQNAGHTIQPVIVSDLVPAIDLINTVVRGSQDPRLNGRIGVGLSINESVRVTADRSWKPRISGPKDPVVYSAPAGEYLVGPRTKRVKVKFSEPSTMTLTTGGAVRANRSESAIRAATTRKERATARKVSPTIANRPAPVPIKSAPVRSKSAPKSTVEVMFVVGEALIEDGWSKSIG